MGGVKNWEWYLTVMKLEIQARFEERDDDVRVECKSDSARSQEAEADAAYASARVEHDVAVEIATRRDSEGELGK